MSTLTRVILATLAGLLIGLFVLALTYPTFVLTSKPPICSSVFHNGVNCNTAASWAKSLALGLLAATLVALMPAGLSAMRSGRARTSP